MFFYIASSSKNPSISADCHNIKSIQSPRSLLKVHFGEQLTLQCVASVCRMNCHSMARSRVDDIVGSYVESYQPYGFVNPRRYLCSSINVHMFSYMHYLFNASCLASERHDTVKPNFHHYFNNT